MAEIKFVEIITIAVQIGKLRKILYTVKTANTFTDNFKAFYAGHVFIVYLSVRASAEHIEKVEEKIEVCEFVCNIIVTVDNTRARSQSGARG